MIDHFDGMRFIEILSNRTEAFFREELGIVVTGRTHQADDVHKLDLKPLTAIMSAIGSLKLYLAYSFDTALIEAAFATYTADLDIAPDERDDAIQETAGDIINIIVGNALADLAATGPTITLSPPLILTEAKSVMRHRGARFVSSGLATALGQCDIHCIGPGELFDDTLEYVKE